MTNVVPFRKDGVPVIPLCKDCENFRPTMGIGNPPHCSTPQRKGDFDPVYGWHERSIRAHDARHDNSDCGMAGNFYVEKDYLGKDPLSLVDDSPFDKKPWFFSWKRFLTYIKR
jgi:hypothetical protein